jgi:hypothetical protein
MLNLYKGLIRSVLECGFIVFDRISGTHMLNFERVQYHCLRIVLSLMQSIHVQTLEVIGGVPPLRMRFSMLNHGYLISVFSTAGHPLRQELAALSRQNSPKIVWEFNVVVAWLAIIWNQSAQFMSTLWGRYCTSLRSTMRWNENCPLLARTVTKR